MASQIGGGGQGLAMASQLGGGGQDLAMVSQVGGGHQRGGQGLGKASQVGGDGSSSTELSVESSMYILISTIAKTKKSQKCNAGLKP